MGGESLNSKAKCRFPEPLPGRLRNAVSNPNETG
jgi:hypothetical protein